MVDLQQQKETAQEELRRAKKEIQTEKLKGTATTAAANIAESLGSLFGNNKVKTLKGENTALHREVADHEETMKPCKTEYRPCRQTTAGRYGNATEARQGDSGQGHKAQAGNIVSENGNRKGGMVSLPA